LTSLSGTKVSAAHGLALLVASLGVYVLPLFGIAAFGLMLSTVTRNSAASVVGTLMWALLMQLIGVLPGTESFRAYLLGTQFEAWHGFLRTPADWAPVVRAVWVCAVAGGAAQPTRTDNASAGKRGKKRVLSRAIPSAAG